MDLILKNNKKNDIIKNTELNKLPEPKLIQYKNNDYEKSKNVKDKKENIKNMDEILAKNIYR
jgi:hypothetical protein